MEVSEVDAFAGDAARHCTIGRNERGIRSEADVVDERSGEGLASSGGDGDGDSGLLGGEQCAPIAVADGGGKVGQEGAVHIDGDEADGADSEERCRLREIRGGKDLYDFKFTCF